MQALCGLQGIFDLFNCKTPVKVSQAKQIQAPKNEYVYRTF